ncbi:MAG: CD0415/CD1112 family protein, partial [Clostridia bacterium]
MGGTGQGENVLLSPYSKNFIWNKITEWLKEILVGGIMSNMTKLFDQVNRQVGDIAAQVGTTPAAWNSGVFNMIRTLSANVILPIAGVILAIVMTMELLQLVMDHNNMHDFQTWIFFKWFFKTACAVMIVTNTWDIVMGIFDMAQSVVGSAAGMISSDANIEITSVIANLEARLMDMELGELFGMWFQSLFVGVTMSVLTIVIFVVIYGRMVEIYLVTSIAPLPMATMLNREWGSMGQNYLRSLFALGFQAFLIIVCVAIYAVLVKTISLDVTGDVNAAIWTCIGYTVLLCFTLFKSGSVAKGIFGA